MNDHLREVTKMVNKDLVGGISMDRLTVWNEQTEQAELIDWNSEEWKEFMGELDVPVAMSLEVAVNRLATYEDAEEQGLLLRLPCKVGDTVYRINQYAKEPIISMKVLQVRFGELCIGNSFLRIDAINDEDMGEFCYFQNDIGKALFITKAEAEKALAEMD